jgi:hypothetical protein
MAVRPATFIVDKRVTECPELIAISFRFLKTKSNVSGFGLNKTFWPFFEF